jgi:hypothetical protein
MVSGFLISPKDQDRMRSGDAIEILIELKFCALLCGLKRLATSWFMFCS